MNNDVIQRELRAVGVLTNTYSMSPCTTCFLLFKLLAGDTLTLRRFDMMSHLMYLCTNNIHRKHTTLIKPLFYYIDFFFYKLHNL